MRAFFFPSVVCVFIIIIVSRFNFALGAAERQRRARARARCSQIASRDRACLQSARANETKQCARSVNAENLRRQFGLLKIGLPQPVHAAAAAAAARWKFSKPFLKVLSPPQFYSLSNAVREILKSIISSSFCIHIFIVYLYMYTIIFRLHRATHIL